MNAMKSKYVIALLSTCLFVLAASGQTIFSESAEYKPRSIPKKEHKKKSDEKNKTVTALPSVIDGDITVTIPISILDRTGSAVSGVKKEEVSVLVDGIEVPVVAFEQDKDPVTMVLVLDTSASTALRLQKMQEQALKLVSELPPAMKVMVVDFSDKLNVHSLATTDRDETRAAITKMKMGDGTSIYSAVQFLYEKLLPQSAGRKVVVLMTDGVDTTSRNSNFAKSLAEVEKDDITIYPIYFDTFGDKPPARVSSNDWVTQILRQNPGLLSQFPLPGSSRDEYKVGLVYLNDLAAASGGRIFSSEKLVDGTKSLLGELANRYYATITVPRKNIGSRPVRVRINRPSLAVFARGSFVEK